MESIVNKNKHINDSRFSEHFGEKFSSQNTRNSISADQDFKFFWRSMSPDLLWRLSPSVLTWNLGYKNILILLTCTQNVGQYDST